MRDGWRTDKPPDEYEKYLVQIRSPFGYMMICTWTNTYYFGHKVISDWHWTLPQYTSQEDVIAWRPLPEPYDPMGKTKSVIYGDGTAKCPTCGYTFEEYKIPWEESYCPHCGQKLDWE